MSKYMTPHQASVEVSRVSMARTRPYAKIIHRKKKLFISLVHNLDQKCNSGNNSRYYENKNLKKTKKI